MFRDVLKWAAQECHLPVISVREKGLEAAALKRLDPLGKLIGPPWTQDQKYATLAALMAVRTRLNVRGTRSMAFSFSHRGRSRSSLSAFAPSERARSGASCTSTKNPIHTGAYRGAR